LNSFFFIVLLPFTAMPAYAQQIKPSVFFCVGNNPQPPCATLAPSATSITGIPSITPIKTINPSITAKPSGSSPITIVPSPCTNTSSTAMGSVYALSGKSHASEPPGLLKLFIQFLLQLLQILFRLLGVQVPSQPVPPQPLPTPIGISPTAVLQPTVATPTSNPCAMATPTEVPATGIVATSVPSVIPTPTIFNNVPSPTGIPATAGSWWKPTAGSPISWNWVIGIPPPTPYAKVQVYDIDGFENTATTVAALHAQNTKVICYIDVGTYEPGRPDLNLIPASDIGSDVQGWPGEKWLNIADITGLTPLVKERMQMCAGKGFDAIEPDNLDGYTNSTGFPLTATQQLMFNEFIANTAHSLGLSVGLKNDVDQTTQLQPYFDWELDEECNKYAECSTLAPFTNANKAVFNAEYTADNETTANFCPADVTAHLNGVLFDLNLDGKTYQPCTGTW
jgi:hypothetical protein